MHPNVNPQSAETMKKLASSAPPGTPMPLPEGLTEEEVTKKRALGLSREQVIDTYLAQEAHNATNPHDS